MKLVQLETANLISGCGVDSLTSPHIYRPFFWNWSCLSQEISFCCRNSFNPAMLYLFSSGAQHGSRWIQHLYQQQPQVSLFCWTCGKKKVIHLFPIPQNLRSAVDLTKQSVLTHLYGFGRIVCAGMMENRLCISLMILSSARLSSSDLRCTPISSIKSSQVWTCLWNLFVPTLFWSFLHKSRSSRLS